MKKKTEADKFTVAVNDVIEDSQFENYGEMMLRRYNEAEAERIAKEIDKKIMDMGDVFITIKVKKVDLPDDYVKVMEEGVKIVEELKESKREIERQAKEIKEVRWRVCLDKRETNDLIHQVKEISKELGKLKTELVEAKEEISKLKGRIGKAEWKAFCSKMDVKDLETKVQKLEGDLEYAKCSGWINRFVYPVTEIEYPVMTYSNEIPLMGGTVTIDDIFKSVT